MKGETMFNPSRQVVLSLVVVALVSLALGLATDVGLFGWSFSLLVALYLGVVGLTRLGRQRNGLSPGSQDGPFSGFVIEAYSSLTPSVSVSSPSSIVSKPGSPPSGHPIVG
jgi:hypothetical protein